MPHQHGSAVLTTHVRFEAHATTVDNELLLASGWNDPPLSDVGRAQARQLGERLDAGHFDVIACSDLRRSLDTARIAFPEARNVVALAGLRETNYGRLNGGAKSKIDEWKSMPMSADFPEGESFESSAHRVDRCLDDFLANSDARTVLVIGHRATQHGLELHCGTPLEEAVRSTWTWQPGWEYVWNYKGDPGTMNQDVEQLVRQAWTAVLDNPDAELNAGFFESGGDSLSLLELITRLEEELRIELDLGGFFAEPTLGVLVRQCLSAAK